VRALRLLHTSDWHLGIELGTQSRRPDHERAIASVVEHCREFRPDAVVHTGDLFDHSRPGADDQALAVEGLRQLAEVAPVVVVGGNHDNNVMLDKAWSTLAGLSGPGRLTFRGLLHRPDDGGIVAVPADGSARRILVCTVPFVTPHSFARFDRPGETTGGFTAGIKRVADAYATWLAEHADPAADKVIWAAHLLVSGARPAGSERRIDLGDDYATSTAQLPPVSYAAFGHIHRAQELPGAVTGRYAGGMLPFRFDESREDAPEKTVVLVELPSRGAPRMRLAPIATGRHLIELTGTLEELRSRASEAAGHFVRARVVLQGPTSALRAQVADALPGAILVEVWPELVGSEGAAAKPESIERTSLDEMLEEWLAEHPTASADPERTARTVRIMVGAALSGRRIPLEDEQLLDRDVAEDLVREITDATDWADPEAEAVAAELLAPASAPSESDEVRP
jgi:exonuclease SbcD